MDSNVLLQQTLIEYLSSTLQKNTVYVKFMTNPYTQRLLKTILEKSVFLSLPLVHTIDLLVKNVCRLQNVTGFGRVGEKGLWCRVLFQLWDHLRAVDTAAFCSNVASAVASMDCFFFPHLEWQQEHWTLWQHLTAVLI